METKKYFDFITAVELAEKFNGRRKVIRREGWEDNDYLSIEPNKTILIKNGFSSKILCYVEDVLASDYYVHQFEPIYHNFLDICEIAKKEGKKFKREEWHDGYFAEYNEDTDDFVAFDENHFEVRTLCRYEDFHSKDYYIIEGEE